MEKILLIDCFKQVKGAGKSIGIYNLAKNLVWNLAEQQRKNPGGRAKNYKILVFGNRYNQKDFDIPGVEFILISHNPLNKLTCIWWELFEVSVLAKRYHADKILYPRGYASMLHLTKEYIIIHDMIPFYYDKHYPGYFNRLENFYIMWRLKASASHADQVITISEASKQDILLYAKTNGANITVINNGYNAIKEVPKNIMKEDYILALTSKLPHKNAEGVLRAYERYCRQMTDVQGKILPLKIIGIADTGQWYEELSPEVREHISCYPYIQSDDEMHEMIAKARVFLFLSKVEGFGFPPVEAMQLGTAVICSNMSSLPEVVDNAAVLVNPDDLEETAAAIQRLISDEEQQEVLIRNGYTNATRFSWERIGQEYWNILTQ